MFINNLNMPNFSIHRTSAQTGTQTPKMNTLSHDTVSFKGESQTHTAKVNDLINAFYNKTPISKEEINNIFKSNLSNETLHKMLFHTDYYGNTALMAANTEEETQAILDIASKVLLPKDLNNLLTLKNIDGSTAIMLAQKPEKIGVLLNTADEETRKIMLTDTDNDGNTVLMPKKQPEITNTILQAMRDNLSPKEINTLLIHQNEYEKTALMYAQTSEQTNDLLEAADEETRKIMLTQQNKYGKNALMYAQTSEQTKALLGAADDETREVMLNQRDIQGQNAFWYIKKFI